MKVVADFTPDVDNSSIIPNALNAVDQPIQDHRYSKKTQKTYQCHIERGKKYFAQFQEMADAFDRISSTTPMVLRAFVAFQCQENNYAHKTAEDIH
ncbi:hypothetical protein BGZ80_004927, partial [Entomortierella chlamydospora]